MILKFFYSYSLLILLLIYDFFVVVVVISFFFFFLFKYLDIRKVAQLHTASGSTLHNSCTVHFFRGFIPEIYYIYYIYIGIFKLTGILNRC